MTLTNSRFGFCEKLEIVTIVVVQDAAVPVEARGGFGGDGGLVVVKTFNTFSQSEIIE